MGQPAFRGTDRRTDFRTGNPGAPIALPAPDTTETLFARYGPRYRLWVSITGIMASFSMVVSGTIVNVAVPDVMGAFGVGQDQAQFLATAYIATMTASQLLNAWFVSRFGPRLAFTLVILNFMFWGVVCYFAPNVEIVILGRAMQGFSAGIIQPLVMVTIMQAYPLEQRGRAAGVVISGLALALGFGPVFGGVTIDTLGWRYIFLIPIPVVAVALLLGTLFMPQARADETKGAFDWPGFALLCLTIYCFMTAIADGNREGWGSNHTVMHAVVGALACTGFVLTQLRNGGMLMDFKLFTNFPFASAIALSVVYGVGNFSINYSIPVFAQIVQGLTPTAAGLIALPASLLVMMVTPMTGRLSDRYSPILIINFGLLMFMLGALLLSTGDINSPIVKLAFYATVCRFGMACITPVLTAEALRAVPPEQLNRGSGTLNFYRQLGGAFGINCLVASIDWRTEFHTDAMTATQVADNDSTVDLLRGASELLRSAGLPADTERWVALHYLGDVISEQARTLAFQDGYVLIAIVFALATIPAWILSKARKRR